MSKSMDNDIRQYIFLLGGHDLEMIEIKLILEQLQCNYYDNDLKWGAKLSSYSRVLNDEDPFVGIELIEDISLPLNYTRIDHHNEYSNRSSSLEQLADFVGIDLTWNQRLIAANDRGYIPEMMTIGASKDEINRIRQADRMAQGVTDNDELLADQSIKENLKIIGDLIYVKSLTNKTSAICDRLFPYQKLLIKYNGNFFYSGKGVKEIIPIFDIFTKQHKIFYGGGVSGYMGSADSVFTKQEIDEIIAEIIRIVNHL